MSMQLKRLRVCATAVAAVGWIQRLTDTAAVTTTACSCSSLRSSLGDTGVGSTTCDYKMSIEPSYV